MRLPMFLGRFVVLLNQRLCIPMRLGLCFPSIYKQQMKKIRRWPKAGKEMQMVYLSSYVEINGGFFRFMT